MQKISANKNTIICHKINAPLVYYTRTKFMGVVMVFEPNFKKVVSSVRTHIGTTQSVIELKLPTSDSEVKEVYSVSASSSIVSSEAVGNAINFVGLVDFQVIYEGETLSSLDYTAEFKDRFEGDTEVKGELIVSSNVVGVNKSVVGGEIRVSATVEVNVYAIVSKDYNVLEGIEGDSAYKTLKDISYTTYLGRAFERFDVSGDIEISDATRVHMVTPCLRLNSVDSKSDYIAVSGVMGLSICYSSTDNLEGLKSTYREVDFSWEVAFDGMEEGYSVDSAISVISKDTKVSSVASDDGVVISISVPVEFSGYVFEPKTAKVVDDVYLESNYLSVTSESMQTMTGLKSICFKDGVLGSAEIDENAPFIDDVLSVSTNNIVLARSYVLDGRLVVEGVANATVVYYTKETQSATSVEIEMPFAVDEKIDAEKASVVSLCLADTVAKSRRGKEIEVSGKIYVYSDAYTLDDEIIISEITLGEEKPLDDCSLYIYIVKPNDTLWDIAKEMNVSVDLILSQNPDVLGPLNVGDKLVIYKPRVMGF